MKKAQVTIFIVIGLIMVSFFIIYSMSENKDKSAPKAADKMTEQDLTASIKDNLDFCLQKTANKAITSMKLQAGFGSLGSYLDAYANATGKNPENTAELLFEDITMSYLDDTMLTRLNYSNVMAYAPLIVYAERRRIVANLSHEFERYMKENIGKCFDTSVYGSKGYNVSYALDDFKIIWTDDTLIASMDPNLNIAQGEKVTTFDKASATIKTRLNYLDSVKNTIVDMESLNPGDFHFATMGNYTNLNFSVLHVEAVRMYTIDDGNENMIFGMI